MHQAVKANDLDAVISLTNRKDKDAYDQVGSYFIGQSEILDCLRPGGK